MLNKSHFKRVVKHLIPLMGDINTRKSSVETALWGCSVLNLIEWEGNAKNFTIRLVSQLDKFGSCDSGEPAIVALLENTKEYYGKDHQAKIKKLIDEIRFSLKDDTSLQETIADQTQWRFVLTGVLLTLGVFFLLSLCLMGVFIGYSILSTQKDTPIDRMAERFSEELSIQFASSRATVAPMVATAVSNLEDSFTLKTTTSDFECPEARGPNFKLGDHFIVPLEGGSTSVYSEPGKVPVLARLPEGKGGIILDGPVCKVGTRGYLLWWHIKTDLGVIGYMSEGYITDEIPWISPGP